MKNKNKLKLILDAVMTLAMLMLYKKNSVSIMFHEIAGLFAIGIMIIHLSVNFLWVKGITLSIFTKKLPAKTRVSYIINALMFLDLILLLISSVLISKKIFHFQAAMVWKPIHFFTSQLLITLMGLHLGLHFTYIGNVLSVKKSKLGKIIFISVFSVIAVLGVFSMKSSGYTRQISMPITMMTQKNQGEMKRPPKEMLKGHGQERGPNMEKPPVKGGPKIQKSPKPFFVSAGQTAAIMIFYAMVSFLIAEFAKLHKKKNSPNT